MEKYKKMYLLLFNKVTDALAELEKSNYGRAVDILQAAQNETEAIYLGNEGGR